jgi:hypothetical protein
MNKRYTSLEHSIRNIMEGRSNNVEPPKTLEQSILEGGHTLEEKVGPRPPNANNKPDSTSSDIGGAVADLALDLAPITGTYREGGRAIDAFKKGEILKGLGHSALTALSGVADIATIAGVGAPAGAALRGGLAAVRGVKAIDAASDIADAAKAVDAVKAADVATKAAGAAKAADAASDSALIRRITSGKKKGDDTPPAAGGQEIIQGNTRLKPKPEDFKPTKTDNKIDVPAPANQSGAPGTNNVTPFPSKTTQVTPSNPNTKVTTPNQTPANVNAPTFKSSTPVTNVKPVTAANQSSAPSAASRTDQAAAPSAATRTAPAAATGIATRAATNPGQLKDPGNDTNVPKGNDPIVKRPKARPKLRLSLPNINTVFDSKSAAGQASGVGTYMHKAGAPLRVSEENEADKARTSIENVARLNSRRNRAVKQQEIQKKILDEKKSLADTVKRNVEEVRTKQKVESPIITNPELKRPEPEGINNVR